MDTCQVILIMFAVVYTAYSQCTSEYCTSPEGKVDYGRLVETYLASFQMKLESQQRQHSEAMKSIRAELDAASSRIDEQATKIAQLEAEKSEVIGFTATLTGDDYRPTNNTLPIPFANVTLNVGNHYNGTSSTFTCPFEGIFAFTFSVYSYFMQHGTSYYRMSAELRHRHNSKETQVVRVYSGTYDKNASIWAQASTAALIHCHMGDTVYVAPYETTGCRFSGEFSVPTSVFTGFLIGTL